MTTFRRKQLGRASLGLAICGIIWTSILLSHAPLPALLMIIGTAGMGFAFSSLTVEVDNFEVRWWFAPKFMGRRINRADIVSVATVRHSWWRGWGIRYVSGGWLYNVSGREAVDIRLKNGRRVVIGTDRAADLARALAAA